MKRITYKSRIVGNSLVVTFRALPHIRLVLSGKEWDSFHRTTQWIGGSGRGRNRCYRAWLPLADVVHAELPYTDDIKVDVGRPMGVQDVA